MEKGYTGLGPEKIIIPLITILAISIPLITVPLITILPISIPLITVLVIINYSAIDYVSSIVLVYNTTNYNTTNFNTTNYSTSNYSAIDYVSSIVLVDAVNTFVLLIYTVLLIQDTMATTMIELYCAFKCKANSIFKYAPHSTCMLIS